ncbi:MAG TPA: ATP-binding protein [Burkholderiales bacterium]
MPSAEQAELDERVLVLAPTARDAALCEAILAEAGVACLACRDLGSACRALGEGAGAAVLSEEALMRGGLARLVEVVGRQPEWSDFPLLLLTGEGADSELALRAIETLGNVTLLERPVRVPALVSAVRAALRARRRQYQMREHLADSRRIADTLRRADKRKDEFLAILAHELRNPLAPMSNALESMRLAPEDPHALGAAQSVMQRQMKQMVRLIDDLLDLSRVSRGKIKLEFETLALDAIVADALEACRPTIDAAGHSIEVSLPETPARVSGDRTRLVQILSNLLSNAAKYTAPGGRIALRVAREGSDIVVSVKDNGVGIPEEMLTQVFDMFMQVEQTLERSQGGLGIGLTLVKRLVDLHGGSVEARSAGANRGTEMIVRLPAAASSSQRPQTARPRVAAYPARPRRILVADDNRDAADSLANMLKLAGHDTRIVYDGKDALSVAESFQPEVALIDIGMPRLNGYDVARALRAGALGRRMLLVALTGWGQPEDKRRSDAAGFDWHLVKPADPALLHRLLEDLPARAPRTRAVLPDSESDKKRAHPVGGEGRAPGETARR